jgi:hypothetical protein
MMKAKTPPMTEHQLRESVMTQLDWELSELARLFHSTLKNWPLNCDALIVRRVDFLW